jgi:photosystem II stability/assembly factor-like uncharacterized protein
LGLGVAALLAGCGGTASDDGGSSSSWLVGRSGALLATADGVRFAVRGSPTRADLLSLVCVRGVRGWAVGTDGTILATVEAGAV